MPITTGKTWHGNTAFTNRADGKATGYATRNGDGSFSNFRSPDGSRTFGGNDRVHSGNSAVRGHGALMARQGPAESVQRPSQAAAVVVAPAPEMPPATPLSAAFWPGQNAMRVRYRSMPPVTRIEPTAQPLRASYVGLTTAPSLMGPLVARNDLSRAVAGPMAWTKGRTGAFGNSVLGQAKRGLPTYSQDRWAAWGEFKR